MIKKEADLSSSVPLNLSESLDHHGSLWLVTLKEKFALKLKVLYPLPYTPIGNIVT